MFTCDHPARDNRPAILLCPLRQQTCSLLCPSITMPTEQSRDYCKRDISILCETYSLGVYNHSVHPTSWCPFFLWKERPRAMVLTFWLRITLPKFSFIDWLWIIFVDNYTPGRGLSTLFDYLI